MDHGFRTMLRGFIGVFLLATPLVLMAGDDGALQDNAQATEDVVVVEDNDNAQADLGLIPEVIRVVPLRGQPGLKSSAALVLDQREGVAVYAKNSQQTQPIASITKLMTAMVVLDANLPLEQTVYVTKEDKDRLRGTKSRLDFGTGLSRHDMLHLALMSSENRAAAALARDYPGGKPAFVEAMNRKAQQLGMRNTRFTDSTGLSEKNVSTAEDLSKMVIAAYQYPLIRQFTTTSSYTVKTSRGRQLHFRNSDRLVHSEKWDIGLSKTGYIAKAGRCLVLQAKIAERPVVIVLLDSWGKNTRIGDANRLKKWLEKQMVRKDGASPYQDE